MRREDENRPNATGYIKLYRQLLDWEWIDDPSMVVVWIHVLLAANWNDCKYHGQIIPRGSFLTSYKAFAERCRLSESTVRRCFAKLESTGEIDRQVTHHGTRVNVRRYAVYQGLDMPTRHTDEQTPEQTPEQTGEQTAEQLEKNIRSKEYKNRERVEREKAKTQEPPDQDPPTLSAVISFVESEGLDIDPERFFSYYARKDWKGVTDWRARARSWAKTERRKRSETLPEFYNPDPIRNPDPIPASPEEIEAVRKQIQKGRAKA